MHAAAKILAERGEYPTTADEWQKLPGIGPYTAAAISSICFAYPVACVDGNVERVLCRLLNIQRPVNDPALKPHYRRIANQLVSQDQPGDFNQAMMELGQLICTPTQPVCKSCPVSEFCQANHLKTQDLDPGAKIKSKKFIDVDVALVIPSNGGAIGLSKRAHRASFLRGHDGFATYLRQLDGSWKRDGGEQGLVESEMLDCGRFRHTITNHRMDVRVYRLDWSATSSLHPEAWIDESEVDRAIVSNLDRKALRLLQRRSVRAQSFSSF
jgi:A/G-specific adenine glycosylase